MAHQVEHSTREMQVAMQFGNMAFSMNAEGVSWSPDVATDMANRILEMFRDSLAEAQAYGLLPSIDAEDVTATEDEEDENGE